MNLVCSILGLEANVGLLNHSQLGLADDGGKLVVGHVRRLTELVGVAGVLDA